jgi:Zn-dependent protease
MESVVESPGHLEAPETIYNCPECSHWLPPGTLACPECHAIVYSGHMKRVATAALSEEGADHWAQAREIWRQGLQWLPAGTKQAEAVEQRIGLIDARLRGAEETKAKWTKRLGPFAPVLFFLAKIKTFFFLLLKMKFLLSFVGFFLIYWAIFGWRFGLGFTLGILIHEMGHFVAARRRGLKVDLPVFIPGLGAYVKWYSMGVNLEDLSGIALAGPFFGLIVAVVCAAVAKYTTGDRSGLFSALAHVTAWLNLLNLIPVFGLDGAQATYALDRMQRCLVAATAILFLALSHEWMLGFLAAGMGWRIWQNDVPDKPSTRTLVRYVLLVFALGVVIYAFPDTSARY